MNWVKFLGFLGLLLETVALVVANKKQDDDTGVFSMHTSHSLPVYHAFGTEDEFTLRSNILFKTSKVTTAVLNKETRLSPTEVEKLKKLVDEDGFYFIRTPTKLKTNLHDETNTPGERFVSTFVPACYLYGSSLNELIKVAVDHMGNVIGLSIVSPRHDCAVAQLKDIDDDVTFNSTVLINHQVPGAVPDTQSFIKKIENDKKEQAEGKGKDNRSFFAKYWMYIVPVVLVLMLSSQAEPEGE